MKFKQEYFSPPSNDPRMRLSLLLQLLQLQTNGPPLSLRTHGFGTCQAWPWTLQESYLPEGSLWGLRSPRGFEDLHSFDLFWFFRYLFAFYFCRISFRWVNAWELGIEVPGLSEVFLYFFVLVWVRLLRNGIVIICEDDLRSVLITIEGATSRSVLFSSIRVWASHFGNQLIW